jgi:hypothetical protein
MGDCMIYSDDILKNIEKNFNLYFIHYFYTKKYNENCSFDYIVSRKYKATLMYEDNLNNYKSVDERVLVDICDFIILINNNKEDVWIIPTKNIKVENDKLLIDNIDQYYNNWYIIPRPKFKRPFTHKQGQLINILRHKAEILGRTPKMYDMKSPKCTMYITQFGAWSNALEIAGFTLNRYKTRNIDEIKQQMIKELKIFYETNKRLPRVKDVQYAHNIIYHFGSWKNALLEACLIDVNTSSKILKKRTIDNDKEVISIVDNVNKEESLNVLKIYNDLNNTCKEYNIQISDLLIQLYGINQKME